ncbi:cytochrome P450 [Zopfia rhizophila CBS 207.26]|uniref:Cytochrome P450 n=1 Tax=Zopfia rhizophila CBS 207.26 TaxID=1314779 RepID=A0A6A6EF32_9PEZI|nr:cytochrome P450 [Zopfia rhizophila CBS 207.26]
MRCAEALYTRGNKHFRTLEPYGITIAGSTTVVIRDTADLAAMWKNTTALSYDPFVSRMLIAFGISKCNVEKVFQSDPGSLMPKERKDCTLLHTENPRRKCYMHLQSEWFKKQLLPGDNLVRLQNDYLIYLRDVMNFDKFKSHFITYQGSDMDSPAVTVLLGKLSRCILSHCALRAFFGEELFQIEPDFAQVYQKWEDDSWKVFYNYPYIFAKDLHDARLRAIEALAQYYEIPDHQRHPCWLFRVMDRELEFVGLPRTDRAGMVMMICWAINNNAHYICFWMIIHMLCTPDILNTVRSETDACCTPDGSCKIEKLLEHCPALDGVWNEALRLYNASTAVRKAVTDCFIGNKIIHSGDQIFGPVRNWQLEEGFFGECARNFRADRWTKNKNLTRSKGFTPFGGGHTYCPGRYFAQRETYMFIAILLRRFELQVTDPSGLPILHPQVPPVEVNLPAPAAMRPVHDIYITLKRRAV